ncbi:MAG: hypothetical protein AAGH60_15560 [Pseudomonadota bacterium]
MTEHHKFWMVYNPLGRMPRYEHSSRGDADAEAQRLARENPGQKFFVLKAMGGYHAPLQKAESIKLLPALPKEIPF